MTKFLQEQKVVSIFKHFAVYSIPVGERDGATRRDPHVALKKMEEKNLEPFLTLMSYQHLFTSSTK
jgi:beta-glucosidase